LSIIDQMLRAHLTKEEEKEKEKEKDYKKSG